MNVKATLLHGFKSQIISMIGVLRSMPGYNTEDLNPYWEAVCNLELALDDLGYIMKDLEKNEQRQQTLGFD